MFRLENSFNSARSSATAVEYLRVPDPRVPIWEESDLSGQIAYQPAAPITGRRSDNIQSKQCVIGTPTGMTGTWPTWYE